ncbi:MAG: hypothetical protein PHE93_04505 [Clostridia bacterium]|nr:hypothetical protein [Clostridia bacterium]
MDYLLPSDETMKRMAGEYAKIKRVCIPRRANAFEMEDNIKGVSGQFVEKAQDELDKQNKVMHNTVVETVSTLQGAKSIALLLAFLNIMKTW